MKVLETIVLKGQKFSLGLAGLKDSKLLEEGFSRLSALSKYNRFHSYKSKLSKKDVHYFLNIDNYNHLALGLITKIKDKEYGIGLVRYVRDTKLPDIAEVAIAVIDSYQNRGLGTVLYKQILLHAKENNIKTLTHYVLNENTVMIQLLKRFNGICTQEAFGITKIMVKI